MGEPLARPPRCRFCASFLFPFLHASPPILPLPAVAHLRPRCDSDIYTNKQRLKSPSSYYSYVVTICPPASRGPNLEKIARSPHLRQIIDHPLIYLCRGRYYHKLCCTENMVANPVASVAAKKSISSSRFLYLHPRFQPRRSYPRNVILRLLG